MDIGMDFGIEQGVILIMKSKKDKHRKKENY